MQIITRRECYTVLHLARKTRSHRAKMLDDDVRAAVPQIQVHSSCTRLRLPNLSILLDANSLNGMLELSNVDVASEGICTCRALYY